MKVSIIFKTVLLALFVFTSQAIVAQNTSSSRSTTTTNTTSSTEININLSKHEKLDLKMNDGLFDMHLKFKKTHTAAVRDMLTDELGKATAQVKNKQIWTGKDNAFMFELKEGNLSVNVLRDQVNAEEQEALESVGQAALELVGIEVDIQ